MATTVELYAASGLWIDLADTTSFGIGSGSGLGVPSIEHILTPPTAYGAQRIVGSRIGNRPAELAVHIKGTSVDTWAVNYKLLARMLRDATLGVRTWLRVQFNGETYPTDYDVIGGDVPDARYFDSTFNKSYVTAYRPVKLYLAPFGRKTQLTRNTGTITNGGGTANTGATVTVTPDSERPAPLRLQLGGLAASTRAMIMAIRTKGDPANWIPALHCETGTHTGFVTASIEDTAYTQANAAVAGAQNGNVWRLTIPASGLTDRVLRWTINDNIPDWYGRFRAFLRMDSASGALTNFTAQLYYTGTDGIEVTNDITGDLFTSFPTDGLVDMGFVEFVQPPDGAVVTSLVLELEVTTNAAAGRTIDFDCLYMIPWDEWAADVEFSAGLGASDIALLDNLTKLPGIAILDSTGVLQAEYVSSPRLIPVPRLLWQPQAANRLIVLTFAGVKSGSVYQSHSLAATVTVTADHFDLFDLLRGAA